MSDWVDIGDQLRQKREQLGLSILDVEHRTKIPAKILSNLEANDYSQFASPVYAKSFLSQYSAFLDVDATDWINALRSELIITKQESIEFFRDQSELERPGFHLWNNKEERKTTPLAPLVAITFTAAAIWAGFHVYKDLENKYGDAATQQDPVIEQVERQASETDLASEQDSHNALAVDTSSALQ